VVARFVVRVELIEVEMWRSSEVPRWRGWSE
jgi:hypothetical protein